MWYSSNDCTEWESLALQYLEDVSVDTISMHHIDGEGVTPTDRLKVGMVLGKAFNFASRVVFYV